MTAQDKESRLPDVRAILALAEIHTNSHSDIDKVVTSFAAIALYAPSRAGEILSLPVDPWAVLDDGDDTIEALRWTPAKGGDPMVKLPGADDAVEMARTAIDFLREIGSVPRLVAQWYTDNPGKLFLPEGMHDLRGQDLTLTEIEAILGVEGGELNSHFLYAKGLRPVGHTAAADRRGDASYVGLYSFASVEQYALKCLPASFPVHDAVTGLLTKDALFVVPKNFMRPHAKRLKFLPQAVTINMINHQLGANPGGRTVFSRNGKYRDDGQPWQISTHEFRHFLNTLAQGKYLPQSLIALWSGRADVRQNAAYDHTSPELYLEAYKLLTEPDAEIPLAGPLADKLESRRLIAPTTVKELVNEELGAIHVTKYGLCRHDYALTPCPKDKDCINCGENVYVKGDPKNRSEAQRQVELLTKAVGAARLAVEGGEAGAGRWLEHNEPRLNRWIQVLGVHTNPEIADGTLCSMPPPVRSDSPIGLAISIRQLNDKTGA